MFVCVRRGDDNLTIAGQLDLVRPLRIVRKPDRPPFAGARRKDLNLHFRLDVAVPPPENGTIAMERDVIPFGLGANRLIARRPDAA